MGASHYGVGDIEFPKNSKFDINHIICNIVWKLKELIVTLESRKSKTKDLMNKK